MEEPSGDCARTDNSDIKLVMSDLRMQQEFLQLNIPWLNISISYRTKNIRYADGVLEGEVSSANGLTLFTEVFSKKGKAVGNVL